jgi:hypothetical protein
MDRKAYERYLSLFNARDYESVLSHFADDFEIRITDQIRLRGRQQMLKFYSFLHDHLEERIEYERFASSDNLTAVEARVHLRCTRSLSGESLAAEGLTGMFPMKEGDTLVVPQYLHYHLKDGKVQRVVCVLVE